MIRSLKKSLAALAAVAALMVGCDKSTSSNGGGGGSPSNLPGVWVRTTGTSTETVTLNADGTAQLDSLALSGATLSGVRYTGTWTGTGDSGSVTWTKIQTTSDGATWGASSSLSGAGPYAFKVNGSQATVLVGGASRTYSRGVATTPTTDAVPPEITPGAGTYTTAQSVVLTTSTVGGTIRYTLNGSTPTATSSLYQTPIQVTATTTIKAVTFVGTKQSSVAQAVITIDKGSSEPKSGHDTALFHPWIGNITTGSPTSLEFQSNGSVIQMAGIANGNPTEIDFGTWSTDGGALVIKWTAAQAGNPLTATSKLPADLAATYVIQGEQLKLTVDGKTTIYYRATVRENTVSPPTFSVEGGVYSRAQSVELSASSGAKIYYTTDGTDPTSSSDLYTGPIAVASTTTIRAIAFLKGDSSAIAAQSYVVSTSPSTIDQNLVGEWEYLGTGLQGSMIFRADGTLSMDGVINQNGTILGYARMTGTWSVNGDQLVTVQKTSQFSMDGQIYQDEPDFQPSTDSQPYTINGSTLVVGTGPEQSTFRRVQ